MGRTRLVQTSGRGKKGGARSSLGSAHADIDVRDLRMMPKGASEPNKRDSDVKRASSHPLQGRCFLPDPPLAFIPFSEWFQTFLYPPSG
ncbi:hypothetical protein RPE78_11480 [Thioclava litoralis]|uniref:Uncharacterized protein n=1 Tax=Thioclava litoralis TaxID=3076557 RepID=A0ABZ1DZ72_9RHOB|nr:hypothetical protein RPE78_11480 [Thioclava sp. FTW29]